MKLLITGANGFVGKNFLYFLKNRGIRIELVCTFNTEPPNDDELLAGAQWIKIDLNEKQMTFKLIRDTHVSHILHLAAQSSVSNSYTEPFHTFSNNINPTLNILEAARIYNPAVKLLVVSSAEIYGATQKILTEKSPIKPRSPYAVSKYMQEQIAETYLASQNMKITIARPFNHIGPFQQRNFAIPSFISQIKNQVKAKVGRVILEVGNIDIIRDFTDVRDVVDAYWLLLQNSAEDIHYNICSGVGYSLRDIIKIIQSKINLDIDIRITNDRLRPTDNPTVIGCANRIFEEFGWQPSIKIEKTLAEIYNSM